MRLGAISKGLGLAVVLATAGQADPSGELVTGASYSSIYGATGFADVVFEDVFRRNLDVELRFRGGEEGQGARIGVVSAREISGDSLGTNAELFARVRGELSQWDFESFDRTNLNFTTGVTADLSPVLSYRAEGFIDHIDTDDLEPGASALILRDEGAFTAVGLGLSFELSNRADQALLTPGYGVTFGLRISEGDGRDWWQGHVSTENVIPVGGRFALGLSGAAGVVEARGGNGWVPIFDRAFLGGNAPRGFSFGGLGPRDPATGDALGGTRFAVGTVEFLAPVGQRGLTLGAFADFGAVWDLPGATAPVQGAGYDLRSSVGISVHWAFDFGTLSVSLAEPIDEASFDETQSFSLGLEATF